MGDSSSELPGLEMVEEKMRELSGRHANGERMLPLFGVLYRWIGYQIRERDRERRWEYENPDRNSTFSDDPEVAEGARMIRSVEIEQARAQGFPMKERQRPPKRGFST